MRGGTHYYNQAHKALNEIGITTDYGSTGPDLAVVSLDYLYRPAQSLVWHRERGWRLSVNGRAFADDIPIGPPDMTPGKAARAVAKLLTEQARRKAAATRTAVYRQLGEAAEERFGWQTVRDIRDQILAAMDADVLAEQDGGEGRG